jgi:hypothetical protein
MPKPRKGLVSLEATPTSKPVAELAALWRSGPVAAARIDHTLAFSP